MDLVAERIYWRARTEVTDNIPGLNTTVVHKFAVVARGMNLLDNVDLDALAETPRD